MKIVKKIPLRRGLLRITEPSFAYPRLTRFKHSLMRPYKITPDEQLHKYSIKPKFLEFRWLMAILAGGIGALFWKAYEQQMYMNELDTIYRYRFHQQEVGSTKIYIRLFFMKIVFFLQRNLWVSAFFQKHNLGSQNMDHFTQGLIRYGQYQNYVNNKDRKFDFLDIGVLEKFPYPKRPTEAGME